MAPGWQWWGEREDIRRGENLKTVFSLSRENGWGVAHGGGDEFRIGMKIAFLGSRLEDERCDWVPESLISQVSCTLGQQVPGDPFKEGPSSVSVFKFPPVKPQAHGEPLFPPTPGVCLAC